MSSAFKLGPGKRLILILLIFIFSLYVSLPNEVFINSSSFKKIIPTNDLKLGLDLVGGTRLTFEADTSKVADEEKKDALTSLKGVIERRVNLFGVSEPNVLLSSFEGRDRVVVELPGISNSSEAAALVGKTAQLVFLEFGDDETLHETDLTGADLRKASVAFDSVTGKPSVSLEFTSDGSKKFAILTERNIDKPLPIFLDGEVVSAPIVQDKISAGAAQISGDFTLEDAKNLVIQLNAGALPLGISLIEERTVGATLGAEAVEKSVRAGIYGVIAVLVFMFIAYRKLGLVADIALIIFGVVTLAFYKLIPVVLTLPGISGFLLSVGMAVDANILIFERYREERLKGASNQYALEIAFGRAWDSIRDANIATLTACFVLANPLDWSFLHVSGPVRGFAITLALGVLISLWTGVFVSRNLLRFFIRDND